MHYSAASVRQLAREVGASPNHLSACFRQEIGLSLKVYMTELRIEAAKADVTLRRHREVVCSNNGGDPARLTKGVERAIRKASPARAGHPSGKSTPC
jgi:AraC-like DNA-binding protein